MILKTQLAKLKQKIAKVTDWLHCKCFNLPFVKVNREKFLRETFKGKVSEDEMNEILAGQPLSVVSSKDLQIISHKLILRQSLITAGLSLIAALPENVFIGLLFAVFDLIQFELCIDIIAQKLLYLYGYHIIMDDKNMILDSEVKKVMKVMSVLMIGKSQLTQVAKKASKKILKTAVKQLITRFGGRIVLVNVIRQGFKWLGITITKDIILATVDWLVVTICASVSALISFWIFYPMANKMDAKLVTLSKKNVPNSMEYLYSEDEDETEETDGEK